MSEPNFPPDTRKVPLVLWRRVRDFICELFSICGQPEELAARHTLGFRDYKIMLLWIRVGEALLRRFLLLEAALVEPQAAKPRADGAPAASPASAKPRRRSEPAFDPANPESWRVSFRTAVANRRRAPAAASAKAGPRSNPAPKFRSAMPLALRLEAILRVYNDPTPFARRLAARLRKSATLSKAFVHEAWAYARDLIGHDLFDDLGAPIDQAGRVFASDSS